MSDSQITTIQTMKELQAQVSAEYADIVQGIQSKVGATSGNSIKLTQNKKFILPDGTETNGPIDVVIVGFTSRNVYYASAYRAGNIAPPECYAEGDNPSNMIPSPNADQIQAETCNECPMNQFGSAGSGKACANQRILAVLPADAPDAEIMLLKVSPSAIGGFDKYVRTLADKYKVPPFAVITQVSFDDSVDYAKVMFSDPVPNKDFKAFAERADEVPALTAANFLPAQTTTAAAPVRGKGRR